MSRPVTPEAAVERLRLAWSQVARAQRLAVDEDRDHDAILLGQVLGMLGERPSGLDPFPMGMAGQCRSVSAGVRCPLPFGHGPITMRGGQTWGHATVSRVWDDPTSGPGWTAQGSGVPGSLQCEAVHQSGTRCTALPGHDRMRRDDSTLWDHADPDAGCWWDGPDGDPDSRSPQPAGHPAAAIAEGQRQGALLCRDLLDGMLGWLDQRAAAARLMQQSAAASEHYGTAATQQTRADALGQVREQVDAVLAEVNRLAGDDG